MSLMKRSFILLAISLINYPKPKQYDHDEYFH